MKQLHPIQRDILQKLLFAISLSYTKMKPNKEMENNRFDFHLKSLIKQKLVIKEDFEYKLSQKGKDYANRIDQKKHKLQAKLSAWIVGIKKCTTENEYLFYTRLKHPFFKSQGFMSGKIRLGEKLYETAKRELKEETNLSGNPELVLIRHYRVFDKKTKKLIEDKFMFLCQVVDPKGKLNANEEGKFEWVKESAISRKITKPFESMNVIEELIGIIKNFKGQVRFDEHDTYTDKF